MGINSTEENYHNPHKIIKDIIENSTLNIPIKLRLAKVPIEKKSRNTNVGYKCHTKYCTEIWHILQLFC